MEAKEVFYLIIKYGLLSIIMLLLKSSKEHTNKEEKHMTQAYKFYYFNHSGALQWLYFSTEAIGFDWIDRYGVEYFDHLKKHEVAKEDIHL
jgi:hypothetical protein